MVLTHDVRLRAVLGRQSGLTSSTSTDGVAAAWLLRGAPAFAAQSECRLSH